MMVRSSVIWFGIILSISYSIMCDCTSEDIEIKFSRVKRADPNENEKQDWIKKQDKLLKGMCKKWDGIFKKEDKSENVYVKLRKFCGKHFSEAGHGTRLLGDCCGDFFGLTEARSKDLWSMKVVEPDFDKSLSQLLMNYCNTTCLIDRSYNKPRNKPHNASSSTRKPGTGITPNKNVDSNINPKDKTRQESTTNGSHALKPFTVACVYGFIWLMFGFLITEV